MSHTPPHIYFASYWNYLDVFNQVLFVAAMALRGTAWARAATDGADAHSDLVFAGNQLLAAAALVSLVRFLNVLETHAMLGPLQYSIRQILKDLCVFLTILIVIMFAFAAGLTKVYQAVEPLPANQPALAALGSFPRSLRTTYWALFGLVSVDTLHVSGNHAPFIETIGQLTFGLYMVEGKGGGGEEMESVQVPETPTTPIAPRLHPHGQPAHRHD